eukprot:5330623-Ditylum_brightwellii.AAC.1
MDDSSMMVHQDCVSCHCLVFMDPTSGTYQIHPARVIWRQRTLDDRLRWKQLDITRWIIFAYLGTKDLMGQFGHRHTVKPKGKMQKKDRPEEMWVQINILSWSRAKHLKVLPGKEIVLLSYMMSPSYCAYLKRKGQYKVGFLGQVKKIVKNCMYLILLINIIQGRNLRSKADRAKYQGSRIYRSMRTPLPSLREPL